MKTLGLGTSILIAQNNTFVEKTEESHVSFKSSVKFVNDLLSNEFLKAV